MITQEEFCRRIENKYVVSDTGYITSCHIWIAACSGDYPCLGIHGKTYLVHRLLFYFKNGRWPITVDHKCRIRKCINMEHLEDVTYLENNLRALPFRKKITHCLHGHEYNAENSIIRKNGYRICRTCKKKIQNRLNLLRH